MKKLIMLFLALATILMVGCPTPQEVTDTTNNYTTIVHVNGQEFVFTPSTSLLDGNPNFYAITYGKGMFVAVADYGTIMTSTDGTSWNLVESDNYSYTGGYVGSMLAPRSVAKKFSARPSIRGAKKSTHQTAKILQAATQPAPSLQAVPAGKGILPPAGPVNDDIYVDLYGVAYGADRFVAVGDNWGGDENSMYFSANGSNWSAMEQDLSGYYCNSIAFVNDMFVATANDSDYIAYFLTSTDGVTWAAHPAADDSSDWFGGVAYGSVGGTPTYVAVGYDGTIQTSSDAISWSSAGITIPDNLYPYLISVAYANGTFVAVGDDDNYYTLLILVSTDGKTWSSQDLPISTSDLYLNGVAAGNSGFVVTGNYYSEGPSGSIVLTSATGRSWQYQWWDPPVSSVAWGDVNGGLFAIARGDSHFWVNWW